MMIKCAVCKTHWAIHAGNYGQVQLYQCTNPDCKDASGMPSYIMEKYDFGSIPTRMLATDTPGLREGLWRGNRWWEADYQPPKPMLWSKPKYDDPGYDEDNPDGLFWA